MKNLLGILVLGLLWFNISIAEEYPNSWKMDIHCKQGKWNWHESAFVVNVGIFFLHLNETEKNENPNADKSPITKPNKVPISLLLKAIKMIPMAATIIAVKVVFETFSLRKM